MRFSTLLSTALLAVTASAINVETRSHRATPEEIARQRASGNIATLVPIDEYHPTLGRRDLSKREDPANLALTEEAFLQWGTQSEDGKLYKATMNITSDDGTKLLFMNRFHSFTNSVDCSTRDGDGLSISFKTEEYLNEAKKQWGWLTEDAGNEFWIITNHKDCAKDDDPIDEFVPYKVTDVDYNGLTADFVKSERKTLREALAYFNVDFHWGAGASHPKFKLPDGLTPEQKQAFLEVLKQAHAETKMQKRSVFDDITDVVDDVKDEVKEEFNEVKDDVTELVEGTTEWFNQKWDEVKDKFGDAADKIKAAVDEVGNWEATQDWEYDLTHGEPGKVTQLSPDLIVAPHKLSCVDCYSQGKFAFEGGAKMEKFELKDAWFNIHPVDFKIMMKMNAYLEQSDWSNTKVELWTIPMTPFQIPGDIFHLGPEFRLDGSFGKAINSNVDFNFGWEMSFPNEAHVKNTIMDGKDTEWAGWEGDNVRPLPFELNSGIVDIDLAFELTAVLSIGYDIFMFGGHEAALKAPLPRWTGNYTTIENEEGACEPISENPEASKLAIQIDQSIIAGLNFFAGRNQMMNDGSEAAIDKELWKYEKKFDTECKPIKDNRAEEEAKLIAEDPELQKLAEESKALDEELAALEAELAALEEEGSLESGAPLPSGMPFEPTGFVPSGTDGAMYPGPTATGGASPFYNSTDQYVVPEPQVPVEEPVV